MNLRQSCINDPAAGWVVDSLSQDVGISQKTLLKALSVDHKVSSIGKELHLKAKTALQAFAPFESPIQWWDHLYSNLVKVYYHIMVCWLQTVIGPGVLLSDCTLGNLMMCL